MDTKIKERNFTEFCNVLEKKEIWTNEVDEIKNNPVELNDYFNNEVNNLMRHFRLLSMSSSTEDGDDFPVEGLYGLFGSMYFNLKKIDYIINEHYIETKLIKRTT